MPRSPVSRAQRPGRQPSDQPDPNAKIAGDECSGGTAGFFAQCRRQRAIVRQCIDTTTGDGHGNTVAGDAAASPAANLITAHLDAAATSGPNAASPNAQTATNTVKAATENLPTFGIMATNTATAQAATAASTATPAAGVSIAGLPIAIAARAQAGSNQFDIRLDPPELGRIDVRLNVDCNGQVTSHVTVDRPETLTLLQSQQPQLERALEQAGLKTADNGLQFSLRDQSFAGPEQWRRRAQPNPAQQLVIPDADLSPVETTQIYSRAQSRRQRHRHSRVNGNWPEDRP